MVCDISTTVTPGQKREARLREYDPGVHLATMMDGRVGERYWTTKSSLSALLPGHDS